MLLGEYFPIPPHAYLALLLMVPLSATLFFATSPVRAALLAIIGGLMFLPERAAFDPPLLPAMDKNSIVLWCALFGFFARDSKRIWAAKPLRGVDLWFLFGIIGAFVTAKTNPEPLQYGGGLHWNGHDHFPVVVQPGMTLYDGLSMAINLMVFYWLPFFMGRVIVQSRDDARAFARVVATGGLIYVPLMLIENVLSPQLHRWVWGFHASNFAHAVRGSGFKPTVFLAGGLAVAMFQYVALMCAAALVRTRDKLAGGIPPIFAVLAIALSLVLSRNYAVLVYIAGTLPVALALSAPMQMRVALVLVSIFISYPYVRATKLLPTDEIIKVALKVSTDRAASLEFRFDNENLLLERWEEKPAWGWGGYNRNRVMDELSGREAAITDGEWMIELGVRGWVGALTWWGIFIWPVLMAWRGVKKVASKPDALVMAVFALALSAHFVDLLPNSAFNRMPFLLAGVVVGCVRAFARPQRNAATSGALSARPPGAGVGAPYG